MDTDPSPYTKDFPLHIYATPPRVGARSHLSPSPSPSSKERGDRFIPSRRSGAFTKKQLFGSSPDINTRLPEGTGTNGEPPKEELATYQLALRNELLHENNTQTPLQSGPVPEDSIPRVPLLAYHSPTARYDPYASVSVSPVTKATQRLLLSPRKVTRKIPRIPYRILDAPDLQDDFYLNLLDWSSQNMLAVGLGSTVYLWNAGSGQVTKLCDFSHHSDVVTSVAWSSRGQYLGMGTDSGHVLVWDMAASTQISTPVGTHRERVGALAWKDDMLCSGSRDRTILQWDHLRSSSPVQSYKSHSQEVCGLKWSHDNQLLASGGNDNKVYIWDSSSAQPVHKFSDHIAAVKALAWSPQYHNLLVSGGGTADKTMRFWNSTTGQQLHCVDTGSQVCNIAWSQTGNELISTHGYSQNHVIVWKYPSMAQLAKLPGHTKRVLYLAMSPDGESVVTGAGDETLRFWHVFCKAHSSKELESSLQALTYLR